MTTIINGTSDAITFPDATIQNTSAIVSGKVPYTNLPAGSVLQVVNATYATQTTTGSATFIDTGLTASITPKFSTSKILVIVSQAGCIKFSGDTIIVLRLYRGATLISTFETNAANSGNSNANEIGSCCVNYLDSPATTSSTTYKTQFNNASAVGTTGVQYSSSMSSITLMEIAA